MSTLNKLLRDLSREIERLSERNEMLERKLKSITGALQGGGGFRSPSSAGRRPGGGRGRRGAPPKFNPQQAMQLRRDYEAGATSAKLAKKYRAALPTILSTLRRAGAKLRRGRSNTL